MTSHREFFSNYDEFDTPVEIHGINGNLQAYGYGDVIVKDVRNNQHTLLAVWYTPELDGSILSKYWTKQYGLRTTMDDHENFHFRSADPTSTFHFTATTIDKISVITDLDVIEYNPDSLTVIVPAAMAATAVIGTSITAAVTKTPKINRSVPSQLMHLRLGHASEKPMRLLGISYKSGKCHPCIMGKQSRKPFPAVIEKSSIKLFRIYSDICPVTPESFGHGLYFIVFVDEATHYTWVYIIPNKSSSTVLEILKLWLPLVERQAGTSLINIRTDGGGEYKGETLHTVTPFLAERGINHEQTSPYSSSSNGVAERMNRTLMNMVRSMILTSGLPAPFWGEALHTAAKILNRLPTLALLDNISPHQAWFGVIPKISHLRVFGCVCFVKIIHPITKVQTRSDRCCFLGYEGTTQYRVYDPTSNKIRSKMRDVTFIEDEFLPRTAFLGVPYADRPLQVPEPRNYSEEDDELDEDELAELFPKINSSAPVPIIPLLPYLPPPRANNQTVDTIDATDTADSTVDNPARIIRWPIPPVGSPSTEHFNPATAPHVEEEDRLQPDHPIHQIPPGSQHASQSASGPTSSQHGSPTGTLPAAPAIPAAPIPTRQSSRERRPTEKAKQNRQQEEERNMTKALTAHTGPTVHSSSPHYHATWAPPEEPCTLREAMASPYLWRFPQGAPCA